jgi:predicted phosphodiesterase
MIKVWVLSDLHYEIFARDLFMPVPQTDADLLVVAGDYHRTQHVVRHARKLFPDIPLVLVAGNHEHYKTCQSVSVNIATLRDDARQDREGNGNPTYFLENESVVVDIDGSAVRLIGATLWTDFRLFGTPSQSMRYAQGGMNDFVYIKSDAKPGFELRPIETVAWHHQSRRFIQNELNKPFIGTTIVVTHHLPSIQSVAKKYSKNPLTPAFASNCDDLLKLGADLWVHGHTHESFDYNVGRTRVVCNPRGYGAGISGSIPENKSFDPRMVIKI